MLIKDKWPWQGFFSLALYNKITGECKVVETKNLITNAGLNWLRDRMYGASSLIYTEMAVGTGSTAAQPTDTALEAEVGPRKSVVFTPGGAGQLICDSFWNETEINVHIREVAIFAGTVMVARAIVDINKSNQESLTITRTDTLGRV
jgi:hypothetical protein